MKRIEDLVSPCCTYVHIHNVCMVHGIAESWATLFTTQLSLERGTYVGTAGGFVATPLRVKLNSGRLSGS